MSAHRRRGLGITMGARESLMSIKVGIVGSGIVGQTLANGFVKHGYDVMIGTNTPSKREELKSKTNGKTKIGTFEDAAKFGEIVVLATKGTAAEAALKVAGIANVKGKTVIDTTNPIADAAPVNGVLQYFTSQKTNRSWKGFRRLVPRRIL
jgi:hypothetical protein